MNLDHKTLCDIAVKWLKRSHSLSGPGCQFAISEVATGVNGEIPDAIGFRTAYSYTGSFLVEVKVSRSDFLSDKNKPHRNGKKDGVGNWRFYMCPEKIITPEELPDGFGLLYVNSRGHVKPISGPFKKHPYQKGKVFCMSCEWIDDNKFNSNINREMYLLNKMLSRLSDPEKTNKMIKESSNRASWFERELIKERKKNKDMAMELFSLKINKGDI